MIMGIAIIVFLWLFFVIIIPQSANILAKQIAPTKTNAEYGEMQSHAWSVVKLERLDIR